MNGPITNDEAVDALREQDVVGYVQVTDGTGGSGCHPLIVGPDGSLQFPGQWIWSDLRSATTEELVAELKRRRDEGQKVVELIRGAELGEVR